MSLQLAIDEETGEWRLPYDDVEPLYRAKIEKAKSGRAKCRMCGDLIRPGHWRIGVPIKWRSFISVWHHPPCFYMKEGGPLNVESGEVHGWDAVEDPDEMLELGRQLLRTEPPAHLEGEVNVEDESFISGEIGPKRLRKDVARLPAPSEMTVKLLPFQEEGHAWMIDRERKSPERGGILADEMGLGKTIQTISMIVSGKVWAKKEKKPHGPTLIVAPSSAMLQWQDEIVRCTKEGTLSVLVYQSIKRKKFVPQDILAADVVLTSYPILENEYRNAINAQKVECQYCGRKFLARKLIPHHKYFCGPEAQLSARLEKTERSKAESTKKAMQTLRIGVNSAPTPTAIYRELMIEAGRTPSSMLTSAEEARAIDSESQNAKTDSGTAMRKESETTKEKSTPKSSASKSTPTSSASKPASKSSSSKKAKFIVEDDDDVFEEEVGAQATTRKSGRQVTFSEEKPKVIAFDDQSDTPRKRTSALRAQQNLAKLADDVNGEVVGMRVVWYGKEVGLFWYVGGVRWRTIDEDFEQVSAEDDKVVLQSDRVLVRIGNHSLETSLDGGESWVAQVNSVDKNFWVSGSLDDEEEDESLKTSGPYIGAAVLRHFEGKDVIGQIYAYLEATPQGDPPLWRARHVDGDVEDLDEAEVKAAIKHAQKKVSLKLDWLRPMLNKKELNKSEKSTKTKKQSKKPVIEVISDDDDEDFEVKSESTSSSESELDDDDDDVHYVKTTAPATSSTSQVSADGPRFIPQTWGPDDAPEEWLKRTERSLERHAKNRDRARQKRQSAQKGKSAKGKGEKDDDFVITSSSSSEGEDDDDLGDVIFAPAGDVVDDDGIDLNRSLLHCIAWYRIVLDEAHKIKERTNSTAKSVFALRGEITSEGPPFPSALDLGNDANDDLIATKIAAAKNDRNAPKKPKSASQLFYDEKKASVKEAFPGLSAKEINKKLSEMWKDLPSHNKSSYEALADKDKDRYREEMLNYEPPKEEEEEEASSDDETDSEEMKMPSKTKARPSSSKQTSSASKQSPEKQESGKAKGSGYSGGKSASAVKPSSDDNHDDCPSGPVLFDKCYRWALTGTPLMNRLGDLYSLVRFIRVSPYSFYFCKKGCTCRLLQWSFGWDARFCTHCGHTPMSHYSYFNKTIMNPVNRNGYVGAGRRAMLLLRDDLLGTIMLRRTKQERKDDLDLPPLTIETTEITLTPEERDFYESIYKLSQAKFDTFVTKGTVMNNYAHVFQLLSRLRQAADHPYLIVASADNLPSRATGASDICRICMMNVDDIGSLAVAKCRHTFHRECVEKYIEDFEDGLAAAEDDTTGKKKSKSGGKKKSSGDNGDDDLDSPKPLPKCPSCHVPLTVTLRVHGGDDDAHNHEAISQKKVEEESSCVICFDRPRTALLMPCGHAYMCYECAHGLENKVCPVCRSKIEKIVRASDASGIAESEDVEMVSSKKKKGTTLFGRKSILQRLRLQEFASSSKLDAIVAEVQKIVESPNKATEKIIVFSQFTTFLDIIQWRLESLKISGVVKLVGSLSVEERRAVLKAFKTDLKVNVILMSLKAGGEGLNLQEATVVLSCDPWWNPSVELQAFHRAHRIGQTRSVRAVRFVTKNTIEERMVELQHKKSLIFDGTVDGNESSLTKLTQEDLRFLFQR